MTIRLYAFTCGMVTGEFGRLMQGGEGDITLPIPVYLIEHPKGVALFDTGLHPDCQQDPSGRLGARLCAARGDREWHAGMDPDTAARHGYNPRDFDLGHKLHLLDGKHDVFGDGSVVCLPTYGHTAGHQSLRLRLDSGEVVLAADACYFCRTLREQRLPQYVHDREAMLASLDRLGALEGQGARIFFGHDPEFWGRVPQAPTPVV